MSSLIGAPLDSLIFLFMSDLVTPLGMLAQIASKLAGAFLVFEMVRRRERALMAESNFSI